MSIIQIHTRNKQVGVISEKIDIFSWRNTRDVIYIAKNNKMLSYRRETALQDAL